MSLNPVAMSRASSGYLEKATKTDSNSNNVGTNKNATSVKANDASVRVINETSTRDVNRQSDTQNSQLAGKAVGEDTKPTSSQAPRTTAAETGGKSKEAQFAMAMSNSGMPAGNSEVNNRSDNVKPNSNKSPDGESSHSDANPMALKYDNNIPRGNASNISSRYARRANEDEYDEDDENNQRRRRKKAQFAPVKKPLTVLEGARVAESNTQDIFVSSAFSAEKVSGSKRKTVIEELKEYTMNDLSISFFNIVRANINTKEKNGIGAGMQREVFSEIMNNIQENEDVLDNNYRLFVRDVVQGSMKAAYQGEVALKDVAKIIITGLMAMSPHDDNPNIMAETLKTIVSEIMYGKVNIGYNMRDAAFALGSASYTLGLYYKEYQTDIKFDQNLENKLNAAFNESVWTSTGAISNYSQAYAKSNIERFMAGRTEEEKLHQKVMVKEMLLSPFKKALNK